MRTHLLPALAVAALLGVTAACGTPVEPAVPSPSRASTATPTQVPSPTPTPTPTPVADEYSQVINGILYQGTQKAPVRIGTDTPGQPPAVEQAWVDEWHANREGSNERLEATGKYGVLVFEGDDGWIWKVFGTDPWGDFSQLAYSGLSGPLTEGQWEPYPSLQAALDSPKTLDGRVLDRAEYVLAVDDF